MKKNLKKIMSLLLAVLMTAGLLAGCGGNSEPQGSSNSSAPQNVGTDNQGSEGKGGEIVINMSMNSAWADLIPYNQSTGGNYSIAVLSLIYDRLYGYDADGNIVPRAADS